MNNQHQGRLGLLRFDLDFKRFLYFLIKCNKYSKHHRVCLNRISILLKILQITSDYSILGDELSYFHR